MAVIEALTEEECYLAAILQDVSGLDLAEFTWSDGTRDDGIWRAWSFQVPWFRCLHPQQIDQCARAVGKSQSVALRAFIMPFAHPDSEMVITAPEKVHLDAITDKIETQLVSTRITREMLTGGRSTIKHQPFHVNFANGARIMGRIPQKDGKGIKGTHPIWLEMDEAQDYPRPGWMEITNTLNRGFKGAAWRAHGVTRGVRDEFYKHTQPNSGWKVHNFVAMHKPTWTDQERQDLIQKYGSKNSPDYQRNVLGRHGDQTNPLFVLHRLMRCVDMETASDFNQFEYHQVSINDEMLGDNNMDIVGLVNLPAGHKNAKYLDYWIGMDVGYTTDPTEILVFGEEKPTKKTPDSPTSVLRLITRIHLQRVKAPQQAELILELLRFYRPKVYAMDSTGNGLPLFDIVQNQDLQLAGLIKGYNFSSKILVDFDQTMDVDEWTGDPVKEAGIMRNVKEYAQDCLRTLVDEQRLALPFDQELLSQFEGGTESSVPSRDQYGRRRLFSAGDDHALDAARMAALGWKQYAIEELTKKKRQAPVVDAFMVF